MDGAIDLPSFRVDVALGRGELSSLAGRERVLDEVGPVLKAMGETALGFDELVRKVADRLDTDASLVLARVRSARDEPAPQRSDERPGRQREGAAAGGGDVDAAGDAGEGAAGHVPRGTEDGAEVHRAS